MTHQRSRKGGAKFITRETRQDARRKARSGATHKAREGRGVRENEDGGGEDEGGGHTTRRCSYMIVVL